MYLTLAEALIVILRVLSILAVSAVCLAVVVAAGMGGGVPCIDERGHAVEAEDACCLSEDHHAERDVSAGSATDAAQECVECAGSAIPALPVAQDTRPDDSQRRLGGDLHAREATCCSPASATLEASRFLTAADSPSIPPPNDPGTTVLLL